MNRAPADTARNISGVAVASILISFPLRTGMARVSRRGQVLCSDPDPFFGPDHGAGGEQLGTSAGSRAPFGKQHAEQPRAAIACAALYGNGAFVRLPSPALRIG